MKDGNEPRADTQKTRERQTGEEHGSIKGHQRGEDDFRGKGDTARGSEPQIRGASGHRN